MRRGQGDREEDGGRGSSGHAKRVVVAIEPRDEGGGSSCERKETRERPSCIFYL